MAVANPFEEKQVSFTQARECKSKFDYLRDQTRTVDFVHLKGNCNVCYDSSGLKMQCDHYICPDDVLNKAWIDVRSMKFEITCTMCDKLISMEDVFKFGLPKLDEEQFLSMAITTNFYESQDIQQCPQCDTLCQRVNKDSPQVYCIICPRKGKDYYTFCWYCMREWKNSSSREVCGNDQCNRKEITTLVNSPKKEFTDNNGKEVTIPVWRACPRKECHTLIEHTDGCNRMACPSCNEGFCFICLSLASDGSLDCKSTSYNKTGILCKPAPIQTKL